MESERRNLQETRQTEEMHFQRNINRLNEELERERNAKRAMEEENMRIREQLNQTTKQSHEKENRNLVGPFWS